MKFSEQLDRIDLASLERVAEGRSSTVPDPLADRLLALGLVQKAEDRALQLTSVGLSLIHSSDQ
ncbi:hypothetical protein [Dyella caseinilytica]|uniref:Uncharacterized protein n=1 Tax=Dyella caseinilytica TaxID=1849581 RepID=A0ABX7GTP3_9GAMM|nr:hypothetical protein [Dyella caseinilytica]QRN53640.1 hypothetical protein ISN74_19935 [Dyella caseinilytica]GFZ88141.1 hypothetical protein GCM10011408_03490 [Dyella caseinilytica]